MVLAILILVFSFIATYLLTFARAQAQSGMITLRSETRAGYSFRLVDPNASMAHDAAEEQLRPGVRALLGRMNGDPRLQIVVPRGQLIDALSAAADSSESGGEGSSGASTGEAPDSPTGSDPVVISSGDTWGLLPGPLTSSGAAPGSSPGNGLVQGWQRSPVSGGSGGAGGAGAPSSQSVAAPILGQTPQMSQTSNPLRYVSGAGEVNRAGITRLYHAYPSALLSTYPLGLTSETIAEGLSCACSAQEAKAVAGSMNAAERKAHSQRRFYAISFGELKTPSDQLGILGNILDLIYAILAALAFAIITTFVLARAQRRNREAYLSDHLYGQSMGGLMLRNQLLTACVTAVPALLGVLLTCSLFSPDNYPYRLGGLLLTALIGSVVALQLITSLPAMRSIMRMRVRQTQPKDK